MKFNNFGCNFMILDNILLFRSYATIRIKCYRAGQFKIWPMGYNPILIWTIGAISIEIRPILAIAQKKWWGP